MLAVFAVSLIGYAVSGAYIGYRDYPKALKSNPDNGNDIYSRAIGKVKLYLLECAEEMSNGTAGNRTTEDAEKHQELKPFLGVVNLDRWGAAGNPFSDLCQNSTDSDTDKGDAEIILRTAPVCPCNEAPDLNPALYSFPFNSTSYVKGGLDCQVEAAQLTTTTQTSVASYSYQQIGYQLGKIANQKYYNY